MILHGSVRHNYVLFYKILKFIVLITFCPGVWLIQKCIARVRMSLFVERTAEKSSLTRVQIQTLVLRMAVSRRDMTLKEALSMRKGGGISPGTYYRILSQAKKNLRRALFGVLVGVQLGLIKEEELTRFFSAASRIPAEVDGVKASDVMQLLDVLVDKLVML